MFEIYKPGQGKYTRLITFLGAMLIVVIGAGALSNKLGAYDQTNLPYIRFGVPTVLVIIAAGVMFWVVNRPKSADFMIATESEMKKVSWSNKKEIIGSTKVVIVTAFIMAGILFTVDIMFQRLFTLLGIWSA